MSDNKIRCFGNKPGQELYADYHDKEWGVPVHDDRQLFEMLILEGAQAGLSWETILKRRNGYRKAFYDFNIATVAAMSDSELEKLYQNPSIIRNRLKIAATRINAQVFLKIQHEFGSFDCYLWDFVAGKPIINTWSSLAEIPATSTHADKLAKDLKSRGMKFVGSTIIYAFMQAVGMVNDHILSCWCHKQSPNLHHQEN
jgi:DNA-3-methyladenine glycosylase I